jgi:hypothetical protein
MANGGGIGEYRSLVNYCRHQTGAKALIQGHEDRGDLSSGVPI